MRESKRSETKWDTNRGYMTPAIPPCGNSPWFALRIWSQKEKLVAAALASKGYEYFLPLYRCRRRWSDRVKEFELPLFPGYLFCRFDLNHRLPILITPGVMLIVGIGKIPVPVDEGELAAIQSIVNSGLKTEPWPYLQVGQRVRIERGSLIGVEGILVALKRPRRLVVSVTILQRSVAVEMDEDWAYPVSPVTQPYAGLIQKAATSGA
jgi:transcription antitermination factor NusG